MFYFLFCSRLKVLYLPNPHVHMLHVFMGCKKFRPLLLGCKCYNPPNPLCICFKYKNAKIVGA